MFIDLHIHSTESDGTDSPEAIVEKIPNEAGIKIFALTDHDTVSGIEKIGKVLPSDIFFINGVEFSCKISDGDKCHILAYFYDSSNEKFQEILQKGNELRRKQFDIRLKYLSEKYGITFSESDIAEMCKATIVGKPHIVNFVSTKFGLDKDTLYKDLGKCYVGDARQDAATVIKAIKEAGGVAVWAHPLGGEGEPLLSDTEFETRLNKLVNIGIQGLECYYSLYTDEQEDFLAKNAQKNNLLISGGSDYHGTNKNIQLCELGKEYSSRFADSSKIIWRLTILQKIFEKHKNPRIRKAFEIAKKAHDGQVDKAGVDYIYHPMTVAFQCVGDDSAIIVALLHDVVEDTNYTLDDLQKQIPLNAEELEALKLLTHDKSVPYTDYIENIKTSDLARKVKLCDLHHNMDYSRFFKDVKQWENSQKFTEAIESLPENIITSLSKYGDAYYQLSMK